MIVPYRDPSADHYRRTAFDIGEWGLGFMTTSLRARLRLPRRDHVPRCDPARHRRRALRHPPRDLHPRGGQRRAVEARRPGGRGRGAPDAPAGHLVPRDRRQLRVPRVLALLPRRHHRVRDPGDRDHGGHEPPGEPAAAYGTLVDERTYAPFHQHFIVARLDLEVDGTDNTVYDSRLRGAADQRGQPATGSPWSSADTPLRTEADGKQDYDWSTQRSWKVVNDKRPNGLGTPVGYKLVPGGCFPPMIDPARPCFQRAEVIGHTLWVTPYRPGRAVAVRRVLQPERARPGPAGMDGAEPADRRHRRRALVRLRHPPHHPAGGLAGDAGRHGVVLAEAGGLLRPESSAVGTPRKACRPRAGGPAGRRFLMRPGRVPPDRSQQTLMLGAEPVPVRVGERRRTGQCLGWRRLQRRRPAATRTARPARRGSCPDPRSSHRLPRSRRGA